MGRARSDRVRGAVHHRIGGDGGLDQVLAHLDRSPAFWIGLVVNTIGAVGTALVAVGAIFAGLPFSAWGLLVLPLADVSLTVAVRAAVVNGVRRPSAQERLSHP